MRNTKLARELRKVIRAHDGLVVSEATMRLENLIPTFTAILEQFAPREASRLKREYKDVYKAIGVPYSYFSHIPTNLQEDASWLLNEDLWETMQELAPRDYVFSSHPGDGACYGYFHMDMFD